MRAHAWTSLRATAIALISLGLPSPAIAAGADDVATAQALFDQALTLMEGGKHVEACPKLEESQKLDPGVGTLFQLATCYEAVGRTASAWGRFTEVAGLARASGQADRAAVAEQRAKALEPLLARLVIDVPEANRVRGLEIERQGTEAGPATWGSPVPVDPGEVRIVASALGYEPWVHKVSVPAAKTVSVSVPRLQKKGQVAEPEPEVAPLPAASPPSSNSGPARPAARGGTTPTLGWIALGIGAAGVAVGAVAGGMVLDKKSTLDGGCKNDECPPELHDEHDAFNRWRSISTVGFVVGAVGVGAGLTLMLTADSRTQASVTPGRAWISRRF